MSAKELSVDPHQVFLRSVLSEKHVFEVRFWRESLVGVQNFEEPTTGRVQKRQSQDENTGSSNLVTGSPVQLWLFHSHLSHERLALYLQVFVLCLLCSVYTWRLEVLFLVRTGFVSCKPSESRWTGTFRTKVWSADKQKTQKANLY